MISQVFYGATLLLLISSCSKKDCELNGSWKNTRSSFLVTTNESVEVPLDERPWLGSICINSSIVNTQVHGYFDNTSGVRGLTSDSITIKPRTGNIEIHFRGQDYLFSDTYVYNKEKGYFKAQGIAQGNSGKIEVHIDITAQTAKQEKGTEHSFSDQMFTEIPFQDIRFEPSGKAVGHYRAGDVVVTFDGTYTVSTNIVSLHFSSGKEEYNYSLQYQQKNDSLYLSKACEYNDYESYSTIPINRIATIKCQSQFQPLNN